MASYLGGLVLLALLRAVSWDNFLFALVPPLAWYLALVVLVPLGRTRLGVALNLASLALLLLVLEPPAWHWGEGGGDLAVLTYNLEGGAQSDGRLPQVLAASGADLMFLQETEPNPHDPMPAIRSALPGWHELRSVVRPQLVLLSRYPLSGAEDSQLAPDPEHAALLGTVQVGEHSVRLINVHLNPNRPGEESLGPRPLRAYPAYLQRSQLSREQQFQALERLLPAGPLIVAGDFNTPPEAWGSRQLRTRLGDSFAEAGWGWGLTYSDRLPLWRIDYVYHSRDFTATSAAAAACGTSDHRPVIVHLGFGRKSPSR